MEHILQLKVGFHMLHILAYLQHKKGFDLVSFGLIAYQPL